MEAIGQRLQNKNYALHAKEKKHELLADNKTEKKNII